MTLWLSCPQLSGYETRLWVLKAGGFLVVDKSSGDICFYKPDDMAKPNVKSLIKNLNNYIRTRYTSRKML